MTGISGRRHGSGGDDGAAAVEMALLTPFLVLMVAGIVAFGLFLWSSQSANFGAREGARLAAVGVNDCQAWIDATTARSGIAVPESLTLAYSAGTPQPGDTLTVTLVYKNNNPANQLLGAATALFGSALQIPSTITVTAQSRAEVIGSRTVCP